MAPPSFSQPRSSVSSVREWPKPRVTWMLLLLCGSKLAYLMETQIPNAISVDVTDDALIVVLSDARSISVPLAWYPRMLHGTTTERMDWRLIGEGQGLHWEALDEDISVENLLAGRHSGESQTSFKRWLESRSR